ncbi:O-antigen ligase [Caldanaerovirga acetigignens]|uniref:O-antigen ligase n=1 Tax=Caldanaerovirga acetigignens TaxID=447595 RepID=A0A1M7JZW6_9FIRM|nr:O-antigen ligase family protein [Caldanaerovirga acetigignens]SHM58504.1 O-antigen ligase [Caldanaerovirga acetigignens]
MEAVIRWIAESLVIKSIGFLFSREVWVNSVLYRILEKIAGTSKALLRGRFIGLLLQSEPWEKEALSSSRFCKVFFNKANRFSVFKGIIRDTVENSSCYRYSAEIWLNFKMRPFKILSLVFLPATFTYAALKGIFSGLSVGEFTAVVIAAGILIPSYFINLNLYDVFKGSILLQAAGLLDGGRKAALPAVDNENAGFVYVFLGAVLGVLCFFLPTITVIKFIVLLMLSFLLYLKPYFGIYIMAFILPLVDTIYSVLLIGFTFVAMVLKAKKGEFGVPNGIVPAALFFTSAILAAVFSVARSESLKLLPIYAAYFITFLVFYHYCRREKVMKTALLFQTISTVGISLYGIYQYFFVRKPTAIAWVDTKLFPEITIRVYATLENPNVLAEYLVFAIPVVLAFIWTSDKVGRKLKFCGMLGIILTCLVMTLSRGGWLGLAVAVLVFALAVDRRLFAVLMLIAALSPVFLPTVIINRIASIGSLEDSSNAYRVTIWVATLRMLKDYWLTGLGLGLRAFSRVYRDYMIAGTPALHAHNFYLQLGLEMGILGLVSFIWFVWAELKEVTRIMRVGNIKKAVFAVAIAGAISGHLFHGLFDHVWFSPRIGMTFWEMAGILAAIITSEKTAEPKGEVERS